MSTLEVQLGRKATLVLVRPTLLAPSPARGFNDTESVALIGGGHSFGKCHGACLNPPCGEGELKGFGPNTFSSGFEDAWTLSPTTRTNEYLNKLFDINWIIGTGSGGAIQWFPDQIENQTAPDIMMSTSDIALREGDYVPISRLFADDIGELKTQFKQAWYRLTTGDMGPHERCLGDETPPAQSWQNPLPEVGGLSDIDFVPVRSAIQAFIDADAANIGAFTNLAYRCTETFRETDYKGGCNGARSDFPPRVNGPPMQARPTLSPFWSPSRLLILLCRTLISLSLPGATAVEAAGGTAIMFWAGRVDAFDAAGSDILEPRVYEPVVVSVRDDMQVKGLKPAEGVALYARPRTDGILSNDYFVNLKAGEGAFSENELALLEAEFILFVDEFIVDNELFLSTFLTLGRR